MQPTVNPTGKLTEAVVKVIDRLKGVEWKEPERGSRIDYSYLSEENLIKAIREPMAEAGLSIMPVGMEILKTDEYKSKNGANMTRYTIRCIYRLSHSSGEYIDLQSLGEGTDVGDKGLNKAMTAAFKYCLRQSFLVSRGGNDSEDYPSEDQEPDRGGRSRGRDEGRSRGRDDDDRKKKVDPLAVIEEISKIGSPYEIDKIVSGAYESLGKCQEFDSIIQQARKTIVSLYCGKMHALKSVREIDDILSQARNLRTICDSSACQEAVKNAAIQATNRINPSANESTGGGTIL